MKYKKPALTIEEQADLLVSRGLLGERSDIASFLSRVNYYRFSAYLHPFMRPDEDKFMDGVDFSVPRQIYETDARLRAKTTTLLEVVEVGILRTEMANGFAIECGPLCYTNRNNFVGPMPELKHQEHVMGKIIESVERSKEPFVEAFRKNYDEEEYLPFWMVAETVTFGVLSFIFEWLPNSVLVPISDKYNLHSQVMVSWMHSLSAARNICAHHSRLWNRGLDLKPKMPKERHHPEFYEAGQLNNNRYFVIALILLYLTKIIDPASQERQEYLEFLNGAGDFVLHGMGFPDDWREMSLFE